MIILGVSGLANIPIGTIIGSILPLVIGMVLGNLFPFIKNLLVPGANPAIAVIGFQLGASMSLSSFITGGISGILLGLVTLFVVGPITFAFERLCGGNGKAAVACSTIAGTAMTTPVALAEVAPRYAELAPTAYAQIATAVIITAIMAPILTGWVDKKFCQARRICRLSVSRPSRRPSRLTSMASSNRYPSMMPACAIRAVWAPEQKLFCSDVRALCYYPLYPCGVKGCLLP